MYEFGRDWHCVSYSDEIEGNGNASQAVWGMQNSIGWVLALKWCVMNLVDKCDECDMKNVMCIGVNNNED